VPNLIGSGHRVRAKREVIEMIRDTKGVQQKLDGFLDELGVNFQLLRSTSKLHLRNGEKRRANGP
jgi:hypothetical protein